MFDKLFGPPPDDMDDKMWKFHWTNAMGAIGAVAVIIFLVYLMWNSAVGMGPGDLN